MSCSKTTVLDVPSNRKCQRKLHRLIFGTEACPECAGGLKYTDSYAWCGACRKKVRVRSVCWLRYSKLSYRTIFILVLAWQNRCTPGDIHTLTGLSYPTIQAWLSRLRSKLPRDDTRLEGIVEMDESFFGKRKHHHQTIVLGARERGGNIRLRTTESRDEGSIETFLLKHVRTDSVLHTDSFSSYHNVSWYGFAHETCNHSAGNFSGTARTENIWSRAKRHIQKLYGRFHRPYLELLLIEWEARHNFPELFTNPEAYLRECLFRII